MSIIVTHINENGIVHAADSNLTNAKGEHVRIAQKVFALPKHDAGMTVAGTYGVENEPMDSWLPRFIQEDMTPTLAAFAESLRTRVSQSATVATGYIFHVAGFQGSDANRHPEFYVVSNYDLTADGGYEIRSKELGISEDFWSKQDNQPLDKIFSGRKGFIFCNGFPSGRQIYFNLLNRMAKLRSEVWRNDNWKFRPPQNISEEAEVLKKDMEQVNVFFAQSNYSAPFIGGPIETLGLPSR